MGTVKMCRWWLWWLCDDYLRWHYCLQQLVGTVWNRVDGRPFTETTRQLNHGVLEFASITGSESGQYICTATNSAGTSTIIIDLNIRGTYWYCWRSLWFAFGHSGDGSLPSFPSLPFLHIPLYLHKATLLIRKPTRSLEECYQLAYWSLGPVGQSYIQFKSILVHCEPQKCFWWQKITGTYDYAVRSCWLGGGSQSGGVARSLKLQKWQPEMWLNLTAVRLQLVWLVIQYVLSK